MGDDPFRRLVRLFAARVPFTPFGVEVGRAILFITHPEALRFDDDVVKFGDLDGGVQYFDASAVTRLMSKVDPDEPPAPAADDLPF